MPTALSSPCLLHFQLLIHISNYLLFPAKKPISAGIFKSANFWGTPNRVSVRPVVVVRWVHTATVEVQVVSVRAVNRTAPVAPVRTYVVQRSIGVTVTGGRKKRK